MNQEKIGKFIANLRKEKNMTQQELAKKLGVTDRAISKWENGRGLPDYSLLQDLCDTLSISINELFSGEKISKEDYKTKAEENMSKLINDNYSEKKKINWIIAISIAVVVADKNRFSNILQIGDVAAQVKHAVKSVMGSSYTIDRRKSN